MHEALSESLKFKLKEDFNMKKLSYVKSTEEAFNMKTVEKQYKSARTGNTYTAQVIPRLEAVCLGEPTKTEKNDKITYKYEVYLMSKNLGFEVSCPNLIQISGMKKVILENVQGGPIPGSSTAVWVKADRIGLVTTKS